ncbi:Oxygen-insensitive NAD(P)H nitroreductase [Halomonadaceae bacterium LMG 33818]|uniref:oxygen-insensitive NAD(P)H nitroreductase n=1 Tax=Cernens ardua TaxID=3402176 RepID=UPI003EDC90AB
MNLVDISQSRYSTKAYDPEKPVSPEALEQLLEIIRYTASSVNSQPWHFLVVSSEQGKKKLAEAVGEEYAFNQTKVLNASLTIVFASKQSLPDEYLNELLEQEEKDGRYSTPEAKEGTANGRSFFVGLHREAGDVPEWTAKQTYIALGGALLGAASLGLDATPIEGFNGERVDEDFGLKEKNLKSLVVLTVGHHSDADFNAKLPKSRLPGETLFTHL